MKKIILLITFVIMFLPVNCLANAHAHKTPDKKGILLVAFGTSIPQAQVSFQKINQKTKKIFPDIPIRWAFTSSIIRKKLAKEGKKFDSVATALAKMMDEGFTKVAVQSLHTIRGEEFEDLQKTAQSFEGMPNGIKKIVIGAPMLSSQKDIEEACKAIIKDIPENRGKNDAVILMGHGTSHPSNAFYAALMYNLQIRDKNIFVSTVEGSPDINDILKILKEKDFKKAYLIPFMSVAGDHARNDMSGNDSDSWKSILSKAGIKCEIVLKGTAEYDNLSQIWMEHLNAAMQHLKS